MSEVKHEVLLQAKGIYKNFETSKKDQAVHALTNVDLTLYRGETLALVGESGCGKSTLGRTLIRMLPATRGSVTFEGRNITAMKDKEFAPLRRRMQMVFQDPYASLDPRMKVRDIIAEPLETYHVCKTKAETTHRVLELMQAVGVPAEFLNRYPHQFSGGQRQRIGIARAIALQPDLIVCDEPVSALDVSVQSQVLNLLKDLQKQYGLTYLFIGHDLSVINFIADRVCVMFLGHVCEVATKEELYSRPMHPYTAFLMDAIPQADPHRRNQHRRVLMGEVPSPVNLPSGCCFHTRCPYATERCRTEVPELREWDGRMVACPRAGEITMQAVINVAIAPLTTNPALWAQNPQQSRLVDELLLGMPVEITGEAEQHMVPVRTFYGYTGWVAQDALLTGPKAEEWLVQPQMVVIARWADVLAESRVQGACVAAGLPLGARVAVQGEPEDGWQAVTLPDGRTGYLRADALAPLYTQPCEQDQEKLRAAIAQAAKRYLGTPYRWGGKTPAGIDCSGLCSMAYLLCGISIWRDSELKEGYPIHPAHVSDMRVGDLVYFPGHVALYLGNGEYIHSTARAGDNGVVINSFYPDSPLYRPDLPKQITAVGSYFARREAT